jgi:hypothetical protein
MSSLTPRGAGSCCPGGGDLAVDGRATLAGTVAALVAVAGSSRSPGTVEARPRWTGSAGPDGSAGAGPDVGATTGEAVSDRESRGRTGSRGRARRQRPAWSRGSTERGRMDSTRPAPARARPQPGSRPRHPSSGRRVRESRDRRPTRRRTGPRRGRGPQRGEGSASRSGSGGLHRTCHGAPSGQVYGIASPGPGPGRRALATMPSPPWRRYPAGATRARPRRARRARGGASARRW